MPQWWRMGDVAAAYFPDAPKKQRWVVSDLVGYARNYDPFGEPLSEIHNTWNGRSLRQAMARMKAHRRYVSQRQGVAP
jgi:hypothetical protein